MEGGTDEDNQRYREFLRYCEEQREESLRRREEDEDRKKRALAKERAWEMLRESVNILKSNEERWRTRRIDECERIKEEEKRDRLAIVREKRKRYGLKKLSVEENRRLKRRTEDRLEIAQAKENYWKQYRGKEEGYMKEEERGAWEAIKEGITALEEDGNWIKEEKRIEKKEEDVEGKEGVIGSER